MSTLTFYRKIFELGYRIKMCHGIAKMRPEHIQIKVMYKILFHDEKTEIIDRAGLVINAYFQVI